MAHNFSVVPSPYIPEDFDGMRTKFNPRYFSDQFPECDMDVADPDDFPTSLELRLEIAEYFEER